MQKRTRFWELPPATWREMFEINVNGVFLMTRAAMQPLLASGSGRIVNIASTLSSTLRPGFSPYGPSKAALEAMTVSWSGELDGTGITANALAPGGAADTAIVPASHNPDRSKLVAPERMVPPLLWLVSRESDGVTGRRFSAKDWDASLPPAQAAQTAGVPAGWPT
jgi:3-oxoacyl-[acyl-carrier protein] reductase